MRNPHRHRRSWPPLLMVAAAALAAAMLTAGVGGIVTGLGSDPSSSAHDMRGDPVRLETTDGTVPSARSTPSGSGRLRVASVGLDVPIGSLDAVGGRITPPGFASAYLVRNMGVTPDDAAAGTVFVVMHSLRGGGVAPGNSLTDVDRARSRVAVGAAVSVAGVDYTVTDALLVDKDRIARDADVWHDVPNRLLLITCLQQPDGSPSTQNLVIAATRT
ncbi:class F sortase [Curtobacterium sp. VKM Ac-1393]|uniref:class F sortase n=1 Tax=Curtobacterium sp. VKM Ac-1393 TaxID=2783814 RepID=UPI002B26CED5|nr:class F sortase [Curtobacterium sp. VKM Ac-1393]